MFWFFLDLAQPGCLGVFVGFFSWCMGVSPGFAAPSQRGQNKNINSSDSLGSFVNILGSSMSYTTDPSDN